MAKARQESDQIDFGKRLHGRKVKSWTKLLREANFVAPDEVVVCDLLGPVRIGETGRKVNPWGGSVLEEHGEEAWLESLREERELEFLGIKRDEGDLKFLGIEDDDDERQGVVPLVKELGLDTQTLRLVPVEVKLPSRPGKPWKARVLVGTPRP